MSKKAIVAKSPEELIALAKERGITFSEEVRQQFAHIGSGALSDDELDSVSGGYSYCKGTNWDTMSIQVGDIVMMEDDYYHICWECGSTRWKVVGFDKIRELGVIGVLYCADCGGSWGTGEVRYMKKV